MAQIRTIFSPEKSHDPIDIELKNTLKTISQNKDRHKFYDKWKSILLTNDESKEAKMFEDNEDLYEDITRFLWILNDYAMYNLREERVDANGQPFVLCIDEHSDSEVLENSTASDRKRAALVAIERILQHSHYRPYYWLSDEKEEEDISKLDSLIVAAVCHGLLFGELSLEEAQVFIKNKIKEHRDLSSKNSLNLKNIELQILKNYQTLIETNEIPEKDYFEDLTEVVANKGLNLTIGDEELEIPSGHGPFLDEESIKIIAPLLAANKISRNEMIIAAKKFAIKYLGASEDELSDCSPPGWFTEGQSGDRGVISREMLVYIPREINSILIGQKIDLNSILTANQKEPNIISSIKELAADEEFHSTGWHTIRLSDSSAPCIIAVNKLTS